MNKDQLLKLGIAEDIADQIIILHGKDIEKHKASVTTLEKQVETLEAQNKEAGDTIESFKKMDIDAIKKSADDYKQQAADTAKKAAADLLALKYDHAIDSKLRDAGAQNVKSVRVLLDQNGLKYNEADDSVIGLDEQLTKIKEANAWAFKAAADPAESGDDVKIVAGVKSKEKADQTTVGDVISKRLNLPKGNAP